MSDLTSTTKKIPKYIRIADTLKSEIARGVLSPGDQIPSYNEMTQRFDVAKHTIDKAHAILEQEGLVRREQGRGIFVEAQNLERTGNIGLLLHGTSQYDFYTSKIISGVQRQTRENDVNVMLMDERTPINRKNIDGILLYCNSLQAAVLDLPAEIPRVLLMAPAASLEIANVVADDFNGARLATRHLLELGHRRISHMMAADYDPYSLQRLAGYRAALDEFGIKFDEQCCFYINKYLHRMDNFVYGEDYMNMWLAQGWEKLNATAVLAPNDAGAYGIMKALNERGAKVPEDISVVGFDGIGNDGDEASLLTTVQVPLEEIGARGAELLQKQIQKGGYFLEKSVVPVQLKIGNSTMPLKEQATSVPT